MSLNVDKELPPLPRELNTPTGPKSTPLAPSSTGGLVNIEHTHPTLVLEKFPSPAELSLISSWHDATETRQVRFLRKPAPDVHLRSFPPPMSEGEILALSTSCANNTTPQQRRESFTRKRPADAQKLEERETKKPRPTRPQKFLDIGNAARSTPNLNADTKAGPPMISRSLRFAPYEAIASTPTSTRPTYTPLNQLASTSAPMDALVDELDDASQALGIDMNDGNIYLTFDPDCRSSCGEAVLTFLSPIPNEISNSTFIPRHRSLSEVRSEQRLAMPRDTSTTAGM